MKKLLSILLTMLMLISVICIAPVSAAEVEIAQTGAPETLYLNAGVWDQAGAIFRAWVWGGSDADKWIYFSDADGDGIYEAPLGGTYTGMKVLRSAPGSTEWTSWNDSGDQTIPTDGKNMLVVEDWSKFSWSTYVAPTPVQPGDASAYYLMGTLTDWATGQNMVYAEDTGVVTTTLELEADNYELKIKKDSNWMGVGALTTTITGGGVLGGTDNVTLAADGGTYTFNFTIATKALEIVYTAPVVEEPTTTTVTETPEEPTTTTVAQTPAEPTTTTQSSEVPAESMTVYFSNNWRWTGTINAYIWNADGVLNGEWPGTAMTYVETNDYGEDIYSVVVPADAENIIFNDGANQTKDIPATALYDGVGIYVMDNEEGFGTYTYVEAPAESETTTTVAAATTTTVAETTAEPTTTTQAPAVEPTTTTQASAVEPVETITVYFSNAWKWTEVAIYYWNADGEQVAWPGVAMDYVETNDLGQDIYKATIPADVTGMLFTGKDNGADTQSPDITDIKDGYGYYMDWNETDGNHVGSYEYVPTVKPVTTTTVAATTTQAPETPEEPADPKTVYFVDYADNFTEVYAYAWSVTTISDSTDDEVSEVAAAWPGVKMELTGEALSENAEQAGGLVYSVTFDKAYDYIIFAGNYEVGAEISSQTADLTFKADQYCYFGDELWYDSIADIEAAHPYVEDPVGEFVTVFFQNNWLWDDVSVYFEGSAYAECDPWPGISMDFYDNDGAYDVYYAQVPADASFIIFNGIKDDGSGNRDQTPNIEEFYNNDCFYMLWDNGNSFGSVGITELFPEMSGGEGGDPEAAPSVTGATLTLGGKLGFTFYFDINDTVMADENAKVQFTVKGETIEVPVSELVYTNYGYSYTIELAAKEMTEVVTAQIFATDFESEIYDNTIEGYALYILNSDDEKYSSAKELVKAMLNYGAAAQVYFGYKTDQPANRGLSVEDKVVTVYDYSYFAPVIEGEADGVEFYGASLVLESDTYLKFYFKVDETKLPEGVVPSININGLAGAGLERNGNLWSITMPSLGAHELSTEFVLEMGGQTVTYSAKSYVYTAQQSGKTALVNLANALGAYGYAAGVFASE
ncbi:MAG: starch-binding protein [Ruminococcaceae bacterium]|nr:starch-binding protein [Oscillospiraceae bacterium]